MKTSRLPRASKQVSSSKQRNNGRTTTTAPIGGNRVPRPMDILVRQRVLVPQCPSRSSVTIEEMETIPFIECEQGSVKELNSGGDQQICTTRSTESLVVRRISSKNINCMDVNILTDTDSQMTTSTTDNITTMIVPQKQNATNSYIVSNNSCSRKGQMLQGDSSPTPEPPPNFLMTALTSAFKYLSLKSLPYIICGAIVFCFLFPTTTIILILAIGYFFGRSFISREPKRPSKRTVNWTINDFSEEISAGFLTCPPFMDKSSQWRLVVCQKRVMEGIHTSFGLIATNIPEDVEYVVANIKFSCKNILNQELAPGMTRQRIQHRFIRSGDCAYTRPIMFSRRQLGPEDTLSILARIEFKTVGVGLTNWFIMYFGEKEKKGKGQNVVPEVGEVQLERLTYHDSFCSEMETATRFVQNPESKTFLWNIPNFILLLKNRQIWGMFSPQFFVHSSSTSTNAHDICSIWRMKLIEVNGVFRLHVQLRGLPQTQNQVKVWYLLQLVDNFGDSVVPEYSVSRVKYPDLLNLYDTSRHILYRRETLLSRFISMDGGLTLRLSLQVQPNEFPLLEAHSDLWLLASSNTAIAK